MRRRWVQSDWWPAVGIRTPAVDETCRGTDDEWVPPQPELGVSTVIRALAAAAALAAALTIPSSAEQPPETVTACGPGQQLQLLLTTDAGDLVVALDEEAAPEAVASLIRLAEGPLFASDLGASDPEGGPVGYFDGLEFDYVLPGSEVATAIRPPTSAIRIPTQVDGRALGLDERLIEDRREAMRVWQRELLPYEGAIHGRREPPAILAEWMDVWRETMAPDFLISASQLEVNQALGYTYQDGLPSIPVRRGAVGLRTLSKEWSTPSLAVMLRDRPELDGRMMMIGHLVEGLDLADAMSRAQLTPVKRRSKRPLDPVRIISSRVRCAEPPEDDPNPKEKAR